MSTGRRSDRLAEELYQESPFLTGVIDVMEMALAKVDFVVAENYASLAPASRCGAHLGADPRGVRADRGSGATHHRPAEAAR